MPTRILHVSQPTTAGVAVFVRNVAAHQHQLGLDVSVACPDDGWLGQTLRDLGVDVHRWSARRSPGPHTLSESRALARLISALHPDVVMLHSAKAGLAGRLALRGRLPTVFEPNAWSFHPTGPTQPFARWWERFGARWVDLFVLVSEAEARQGREVGVRGRYVTIPHGVDPDAFPYADDAARAAARQALGLGEGPTVVCVGRLCEQKGQDLLLQAWAEVRGDVPEARLVLVGDGPTRAELETVAPPGVEFAGDRSDVHAWLAASDVVAVSSRWEAGISFATLEAWSTGRPVVTFDMMDMDRHIGEAGAAVPFGDVTAFAEALVGRLGNPAQREREGRAGRELLVSTYSQARSVARVTDATLELLRTKETA